MNIPGFLPAVFQLFTPGVHTIQRMYGWEISPDLTFKRGFEQCAYDCPGHIDLHVDCGGAEAVNEKHKWEAERSYVERAKAYLEEETGQWPQKYPEMGKDTLLSTDPPSALVTHHSSPKGEVNLRCRAQNFYLVDISLTWIRDGEEQLLDTESIETRPAGNGTFQKWAAMGMPSGQEGRYTCRVQHEELLEPLTLKWEPESSSIRIIVGVIAAVLTAVIPGVVIWRNKKSGGQGGDYFQAADNDSAQGSDVSLTAKGETLGILELERGWCKEGQAEEALAPVVITLLAIYSTGQIPGKHR
ncbi:LOW QUALITY PROTEIN: H-2 class I histocompatibility antigen, alpha chain-like [Dromiciops gliroides]|uniref:LOW QUALITY PROTEIN: H-2 class I histocompatibility antigen, alpha chain-like n=1 Tax=Dromiciops gliroides TaxID=33562 RepID=UPI001CC365A8|nr:LOW QUALITY PROTEIN: H-2 class I histocompatibility antigen, alpha chain-like [Dromiciops gliroides]